MMMPNALIGWALYENNIGLLRLELFGAMKWHYILQVNRELYFQHYFTKFNFFTSSNVTMIQESIAICLK